MSKLRLEHLLILAVLALLGQLVWPSFARWRHLPTPGKIGVDRFDPPAHSIAADYLAYLPRAYGGGSWPLVVFLHGAGERGQDSTVLRGCGPFGAVEAGIEIPAIIVSPQCLPGGQWEPDSVVAFVEQVASRYRVDRDRVYLIGYSMGGYGTWQTAAAHPELFAAIVLVSGGGTPDSAKRLVGIPIWAFQGAKDDAVPVAQIERMIEVVSAGGGQPRFTIIPDAGHEICNSVCGQAKLWEWLMRQNLRDRENLQSDTQAQSATETR